MITDNDPALAKSEAERLAAMLWALRDKLEFDLPEPAKAVSMAMAGEYSRSCLTRVTTSGVGPPAIAPSFSRSLFRQKAEGWVVALFDAEAVQRAAGAGVGKPFEFRVGGKTDRITASRS